MKSSLYYLAIPAFAALLWGLWLNSASNESNVKSVKNDIHTINDKSEPTTNSNAQLTIAVSANFSETFTTLKTDLQHYCQCKINHTFGSSGILATQMDNGAPFDIFMSADKDKPQWLYRRGKTLGEPITYAVGQLVLLDKHRDKLTVEQLGVATGNQAHWRIAIANAQTAPYGLAAEQVLASVGNKSRYQIIRGNSILQALQYFKTGNVDQAIISRSLLKQLYNNETSWSDSSWVAIPESLHQPIVQQMVVSKYADASLTNKVVEYFQLVQTQNKLNSWGYLTRTVSTVASFNPKPAKSNSQYVSF